MFSQEKQLRKQSMEFSEENPGNPSFIQDSKKDTISSKQSTIQKQTTSIDKQDDEKSVKVLYDGNVALN